MPTQHKFTADATTEWADWPYNELPVAMSVGGDFGGGTCALLVRRLDNAGDPDDTDGRTPTGASFTSSGDVIVTLGSDYQYAVDLSGSTAPDLTVLIGG